MDMGLKKLKWMVLAMLVMLLHAQTFAQDLHFSQFFNSPLSTNPANTGFVPVADYRLGAHYRDQWTSIPVPYKTISIFGDFQFMRDRFRSGWIPKRRMNQPMSVYETSSSTF